MQAVIYNDKMEVLEKMELLEEKSADYALRL